MDRETCAWAGESYTGRGEPRPLRTHKNMKHILLPGLLASLAMVAVSFILTIILGALVPSIMAEYQTVGLFRPWSDPLMSLMYVPKSDVPDIP